MKKKDCGSKKKNRLMAFATREEARLRQGFFGKELDEALKNNDMEAAAKLMGIKLK